MFVKRVLFSLTLLLALSKATPAQTATVTANNILDNNGRLLATGEWCFGANCFPVANGAVPSGSFMPLGTGTVTVTSRSRTLLTVTNVSIAGGIFSWDKFIVPSNGKIYGMGAPYLPCTPGASYVQTDSYQNLWYAVGADGACTWNRRFTSISPNPLPNESTTTVKANTSAPEVDYLPLTGGTLSGPLYAPQTNSVLNAASCGYSTAPSWCSGSDIGGWVTAAFASCSSQCEVDIPMGHYSFGTSVSIPLISLNSLTLKCLPGSFLTYTGTGDAFVTVMGGVQAGLTIAGCNIAGNSSATSNGIHLTPGNGVKLVGNTISGFGGVGLLNEGSEALDAFYNFISGNTVNVLLRGTGCTTTAPITCSNVNWGRAGYTSYSSNAGHFKGGYIVNATNYGVELQNDALNNSFDAINFEGNVTAIFDNSSVASVYTENYFEASSHYIVVGSASSSSSGTQIIDNYFTVPDTAGYTIELVNATTPSVNNNSEVTGGGTTNTCFVNTTTESYLQAFGNTIVDSHPFCTRGAAGLSGGTEVYTDTNNWIHFANHLLSPGQMTFQPGTGFAIVNSAGTFQNLACTDGGACTLNGAVPSITAPNAPATFRSVTAASFNTVAGTTLTSSGTFTTVYTFPAGSIGTYLVSSSLNAVTNNPNLYSGFAVVSLDGTNSFMLSQSNGTDWAQQVSGLNFQIKQLSGGAQTIAWTFTKLK
jgi:hypothetical protein